LSKTRLHFLYIVEDSAYTEGGGVSEETGPLRDEPEVVPVDPEAQQRELEQAGWERLERLDKAVWRHPRSGHFYPQGAAIQRLRWDRRTGQETAT
jgi:hypothetical protein